MGGKYPFYPISARRICLYHKIFITVIQICHNILNSFQKTWQPKHIYDWPLTCWNYSQIIRVRSELEFIIYHYWYYTTCSYLGHAPFLDCSRTHNKTLQVLQRTTIESRTSLSQSCCNQYIYCLYKGVCRNVCFIYVY